MPTVSAIYISYRRDDAAGHAGRLYDALAARLGTDRVQMDVDVMSAGQDLVARLEAVIASCEVVLPVIGPSWVSSRDDAGERRLDRPDDFVRLELATALRHPNVRVLPVLVNGATPPSAGDLPGPLRQLASHPTCELRDRTWRYDVQRLGAILERLGGMD